jgi:hypothetical protein
VISKAGVLLILNFKVPFINQKITTISLSGVTFSSSNPSAECTLNDQSYIALAISFNAAVSTIEIVSSLQLESQFVQQDGLIPLTCRISNLVNVPSVRSARSDVSLAIFGDADAPLYTQSGINFPATFDQGLGLNRPRVRPCLNAVICSGI